MKLYTLGYNSFSFYEFLDKIKELDAVIVDIRFHPWAFTAFWKQEFLAKKLGDKYFYIKELGNELYLEKGHIKIYDFDAGYAKLLPILEGEKPVILFCACEDYRTCHRKVIADKIVELDDKIEIVHIQN